MRYYHAIVITDYDAKIKYHNISNPKIFVSRILKEKSVYRMFFYRLPYREAKEGKYCGYWNEKRGLTIEY